MVYGLGAVANFNHLGLRSMLACRFGLVKDRRAFLAIDNVTSIVQHRLETLHFSSFSWPTRSKFQRRVHLAASPSVRATGPPPAFAGVAMNHLGLRDALIGSLELDTRKANASGGIFH